MKKILVLLLLLNTFFIVVACSNENNNINKNPVDEIPNQDDNDLPDIIGEAPVFINLEDKSYYLGDQFSALENVIVMDEEDGDISRLVVVMGIELLPLENNVFIDTGTYELTYLVMDSDLNVVTKTIEITITEYVELSACDYQREGYIITWCDDFTGIGENLNSNGVDLDKWGFQLGTGSQYGLNGWGNNEQQFYLSENAIVRDNQLIIEAKRETHGGMPYTSARLYTQHTFSQKYGRFEAMISLPVGEGLWPAFWLMPKDSVYGGWANSGEIDIMEARGRFPNEVSSAIHYGGQWPNNRYTTKDFYFPSGETIANNHLYAVEWDETEMRFYVNDIHYHTVTNWYNTGYDFPAPFDQQFYIILNLAVGGSFDGNRVPPASLFDEPVEMIVSFVRVYQRVGD
jgi:beta-glucanase (GH16 family)